jgi:hypothetical protein
MTLTLAESAAVTLLAKHLYEFLPGSGNSSTAFPIAAQRVGIPEAWAVPKISKLPGITQMLTWTLEQRRDRFSTLMIEIIKQSMSWRSGKGNPLTRQEVEELNRLLVQVRFKIPDLCDESFLQTLPQSAKAGDAAKAASVIVPPALYQELKDKLLAVSGLQPQPRGYAFEKFLVELFAVFGLAPRGSFRPHLAPNPLQGIESELRKCTVPTRIVWGMRDEIFATRNPDYLYSILPEMMGITRLRTAKLFFPEEYPDIIAKEARSLWELSSVRFFNNG